MARLSNIVKNPRLPTPFLKYFGERAHPINAVLFKWCTFSGSARGLIAVTVITRKINFKIS